MTSASAEGVKIIYVMTGLELGSIHHEQKEMMYKLWSGLSDDALAAIGLKRVPADGGGT